MKKLAESSANYFYIYNKDANNINPYFLFRNHIENFSKIPEEDWGLLVPHRTLCSLRIYLTREMPGKSPAVISRIIFTIGLAEKIIKLINSKPRRTLYLASK